jgi:hypothetical protein
MNAWLVFIVLSFVPLEVASGKATVALIYKLEGRAEVIAAAGDEPRPAVLYDWLRVGDEVRVSADGLAAVVFSSGARYELRGPAVAELAADGFQRTEGKVEARTPLAPLPRDSGILRSNDFADTKLGGVVLRGSGIAWMYPRRGAATIAGQTSLRLGEGTEGGMGFRIVLEDENGAVLLHTVVKNDVLSLAPDLLVEGRRYFWRAIALGETGTTGSAEGEFRTLDSVRSSERQSFQESMESTTDPYLIALGAEADRSLGLLWESREGFCRAHRLVPEDLTLGHKCEELESELKR